MKQNLGHQVEENLGELVDEKLGDPMEKNHTKKEKHKNMTILVHHVITKNSTKKITWEKITPRFE